MQVDFIIVGQGIAGTVLAHQLQSHGQKIMVIDKPHLSTSSAVAAGIWNPIVFKRLSKSWMADEVLPVMMDFYKACGQKLHSTFIAERNLVRSFSEEQEMVFWKKKAQAGNLYLDDTIYQGYQLTALDVIGHYAKVRQSGNLHVQSFLQSSKLYFMNQERYLDETFDHSLLQVGDQQVNYKHITARYIVFCEGYLVHKNPFFRDLPMKPAKGEILTVKCDHLNLDNDIFNKNFFILPLGNHLFKVGATYEWEHLNDLPTEKAKEELLQKLKAVLHVPFEVIHHEAGVRPSVIDRRPVLGAHPQRQNVLLLNGFGTKAVMLAPYFSGQLCDFILFNKPLNPEVDIKRFHKNE